MNGMPFMETYFFGEYNSHVCCELQQGDVMRYDMNRPVDLVSPMRPFMFRGSHWFQY